MKKLILIITGAAVAITLSSCVKETIYDAAQPTGAGKITLTTVWTDIGTGIAIPANYAVKVGEYSATVSGTTNTLDNTFTPGVYHAVIHNTPDKIDISGVTATVQSAAPAAGVTGTFIDPMPGWLFSNTQDVTIRSNENVDVTANMTQQVRELNFVLTPTGSPADGVSGITGTFEGAASTLNMDSGEVSDAANVVPVFTKQPDGTWKATVRLLGVTGAAQILSLKISFTGANPGPAGYTVNLTSQLTGFNTHKKTPVTLQAQIDNAPSPANFTATITDWVAVTNTGEAN